MNKKPLLSLKSLKRTFHQGTQILHILKGIDLDLYPGEIVALVGPSGSGKSTLLKIIAGVTKPSDGRITVNGRIAPLIELGAGFHPELTGRENVFLNGAILGMRRHEVTRRFDEIVGFAELEDFIEDRATGAPSNSAGAFLRRGEVEKVLSTLTDREAKIIKLRFGIDSGYPRTLEEVGRIFRVTRERVRQIEAKAIRKLRHPSRSKSLRDYLD